MGAVTTIVPVVTVQVGWVVAEARVTGAELINTLVPEEIQPSAFLAVTRYVPGETGENTPLVLV